MTREKPESLYHLAIEIESKYSNCFSRKQKKQQYYFTKIFTFLKCLVCFYIYWMQLFVEWNCQTDTSNSFFSYLWKCWYHTVFCCYFSFRLLSECKLLVSLRNRPRGGKETPYWITCLHPASTLANQIAVFAIVPRFLLKLNRNHEVTSQNTRKN